MNLRSLICAAVLGLTPLAAQAECASKVATGIDISGSVSRDELLMQLGGVTAALQSPAVISAISAQGCVTMTVYVWGENQFVVLLPWTDISSIDDAVRAEALLTATAADYQVPSGQLTNTAGALQFAWQLFGQIPPTGRQILNVVSNGIQNTSGNPMAVSAAMRAAGVTINGVVFGPSAELETWFRENVTGGRGSFVMRIDASEDVAAAFRSKFILDLASAQ
jgi:hypothetical protein